MIEADHAFVVAVLSDCGKAEPPLDSAPAPCRSFGFRVDQECWTIWDDVTILALDLASRGAGTWSATQVFTCVT
jgi:hypothetical protein